MDNIKIHVRTRLDYAQNMLHILGSILHTTTSRTYQVKKKRISCLTLTIFAAQLQLWNLIENLCDVKLKVPTTRPVFVSTFPNLPTLIQNSIWAKCALRIQIFSQYTIFQISPHMQMFMWAVSFYVINVHVRETPSTICLCSKTCIDFLLSG